MNAEEIRIYCMKKFETTESFPFNETTLVFKVKNKMFALLSLDEQLAISLKCDPEKAIDLRENYEHVKPGYHMNKKHWNTVNFEGDLSDEQLKELINHSYEMVVNSLTKAQKAAISER